jgi:hypothetical protein
MTLREPATFLTDLLLALLATWLAWRLRRETGPENRAARWMARTLALTALSALVGGCYHGWALNFSPGITRAWWRLTLWVIDLVSVALAMSLAWELVPPERRRGPVVAIAAKFFLFAAIAAWHSRFIVAIADYGTTLIAWLVATILLRRAWRGAMTAALALSVVAAVVQQSRWAPTPRFNHNDLYHVIQAGALAAFYRAGRKLGPIPETGDRKSDRGTPVSNVAR